MKYGSLVNILEEGIGNKIKLEVGMGATMLSWTDRHAGTIVAFDPNGKWVDIQEDTATRILKEGENPMSECQRYAYTLNLEGTITRYKRARNGRLTHNGRNDGTGLIIGHRENYFDYSF